MRFAERFILPLLLVTLSPSAWSLMDGWSTWEAEKLKEETRRQSLIEASSKCSIEDANCTSFQIRQELSYALHQLGRLPDGLSFESDLIPELGLEPHEDEARVLFLLLIRDVKVKPGSDLSLLIRQIPATRKVRIWEQVRKTIDGDASSVCVRAGFSGVSITCLAKIIIAP